MEKQQFPSQDNPCQKNSTSDRKFVIFDLDGTLIDSYECVLRCINKVLLAKGLGRLTDKVDGIGNLFKQVYTQYNEISSTEFKQLFDLEHNNDIAGIKIIPKNFNLLQQHLKQGLRIVILTNKRQCIAELICKTLLCEYWNHLIVIGRMTSKSLKDFPKIVCNRLAEYNLSINDCLHYYGDSAEDMILSETLNIPFSKV